MDQKIDRRSLPISRRRFLNLAGLGLASTSLMAACGTTATAPPPSPASAKPDTQSTAAPAAPKATSSTQAPSPSASPAAKAAASPAASPAAKADWQEEWDRTLAAARQEGKIVISGPPNPDTRVKLPAAFKRRFDIDMEYLAPGSTSTLLSRLEVERQSGQYTLDAIMGGAQSLYTTGYNNRMYDPIPPVLIHPEAIDSSKWITGRIWYMDPEQQYILRLSNYVSTFITVNTDEVRAQEIAMWKDLLDPKYRGKISVYDPTRPGTGWNTAQYLLKEFGEDYIRSLYQGQQPFVSSDSRELADRMARGTYPLSLGLGSDNVERLKGEGLPIMAVHNLADAPGAVTAGFGLGVLLNRAPHPNAAKLFINWMATKEGQTTWHESENTVSIRTDLENAWAPDYTVPKPGVDYFDTYDWDFTVNSRSAEGLERITRLTQGT